MNQATSDPTLNYPPFQPLGNARGLDFLPQACLGLRFGRHACARCEIVCPVKAIRLEEDGLAMNGQCMGCGRCAANCPAGVLRAKGFDGTAAPLRAVTLDCWKVPSQHGQPDGLRIPCLGGLSKSDLLELLLNAQGQPVRLLDRGWCHACVAGSGQEHPAAAVLAEVSQILEKIGTPLDRWPQLVPAPLPITLMPAEIPAPLTQQVLSRRGFFKALLTETADSVARASTTHDKVAATARGMDEAHPAGQVPLRTASLTMQLALRAGTQPSAAWFPAVELGSNCCNQGICAAVCPAGALQRYEEDGASGIQFDPALCLECGMCETVCPEHAAHLLPEGNANAPVQPIRLNRFAQTTCPGCGKKFSQTSQRRVCADCGKRSQMRESLFGMLFAGDRS